MITCTRKLTFCAGHRVYGHEGKCASVHGHNYVVFVTAESGWLDDVGRVVDFSVIKERLGGWIDACWDHRMILMGTDPIFKLWEPGGPLCGMKVFPMGQNPTAENMAQYLLDEVCPDLFNEVGVRITKIKIYETENCYATARH